MSTNRQEESLYLTSVADTFQASVDEICHKTAVLSYLIQMETETTFR